MNRGPYSAEEPPQAIWLGRSKLRLSTAPSRFKHSSTVIAGIGFGLFQTPNNRVLLLSAPKARSGAAGAMQGTARLTGQTFGAISMTMVFGIVPLAAAPNVALVLAAACAGLAGLISLGRARHEVAG